ncbi:MAG: hypothetical protein CJBNEKGG_01041 [Prosthecobacter sp.]|nr:hypothetical protein [Prosthecobacter sp.]
MARRMSLPSAASSSSHPMLRVVVYGAAVVLALLHVFVTFRGLSSEAGMEQAQLAREIARGRGYQTKVIRPHAWARLESHHQQASPAAMPEITQPPLQALVWAPVFKLLERHQPFDPVKGGSIYLLDRAVACLGVLGFLLTLWWTHGAARCLFDETVAAVALLCLMVCEPLWQLAVSGSPLALLTLLFALGFRLLASAQVRVQEGQGVMLQAAGIGLLAALMLLTHWMALWLVAGLILACALTLKGGKPALILIALLPLAALAAWGLWLTQACGDPLGGAKPLFQAHLLTTQPSLIDREFSLITQPVYFDDLLRKMVVNWRNQLSQGFAHLACLVPAAVFFIALMHRFRRQEITRSAQALAVIFGMLAIGLGMLGLPEKTEDDNALYIVLAPAMTVIGCGMLAVLWSRFRGSMDTSFWARLGFAVLAVASSALPMAAELPSTVKMGLVLRGRIHPQWPPYVPDRVTFVRRLIDPDEVVFSDAPWFVAWYADVPTIWLPVKRSDFTAMTTQVEARGGRVAGIVVTPLSARVNHLHEAFDGPYREWPDLIFRGPMLALDREFIPHPEFKFKVPLPLVAVPVGGKENLSMQMTFYTDRIRSIQKQTP